MLVANLLSPCKALVMNEEIARLRGRARLGATAGEGSAGGSIGEEPMAAYYASWVDKLAPAVEARALAALRKRDRVSYNSISLVVITATCFSLKRRHRLFCHQRRYEDAKGVHTDR